jgi:hypothetical protein
MNLPIVVEYHTHRRQPFECLCVECGAIRPTLDMPKRVICTGLKPIICAAAFLHAGMAAPVIIHEPIVRRAKVQP